MAKAMDCKATHPLLELKRGIISKGRAKKYISNTRTLEMVAGAPLDTVLTDLEKTRRLGEKIESSEYTPATRSDLRLLMKMLWKIANGHDLEDRPKEIRWLKVGIARKDMKHPKKISEDEFKRMLAAAGGRDKAILSILYECGLRPHELLSLKKNSIEFCKEGARISVPEGTKTGARNILVIDSEPAIAGWLAAHPLKGDNAPLFPAQSGKNFSRQMGTVALNNMIKSLAVKAGITRQMKTYALRHTAATKLASILTDAQMKAYFGWTQDSRMASVYINISGRDVDSPLLAAHGKKVDKTELEGKLEPKICKRCGKQNAHDATMCQYCGLSVDKEKIKSDMLSMQEELAQMKARDKKKDAELERVGKEQEAQRKEMENLAKKLAAVTVGQPKRGQKAAIDDKG